MTKWARIVGGRSVDTRSINPEGYFTDNIVAEFVVVPNVVEDGWYFSDGQWSAPPVPPPPIPAPRTWSVEDVRAGLTFSEKVTWDNNSKPEVVTAKLEFPCELDHATEVLSYLVSANVISQASLNKILA